MAPSQSLSQSSGRRNVTIPVYRNLTIPAGIDKAAVAKAWTCQTAFNKIMAEAMKDVVKILESGKELDQCVLDSMAKFMVTNSDLEATRKKFNDSRFSSMKNLLEFKDVAQAHVEGLGLGGGENDDENTKADGDKKD